MKKFAIMLWVACIAVSLSSRVMAAEGCGLGPRGGELPIPFDLANKKVELADNEPYILAGRVTLMQVRINTGQMRSQPVFRVDLTEHPWLANEKRLNNPHYVLQGSMDDWKDLITAGKIKLPCIAHGVITVRGSRAEYDIQLERAQEIPVEPMSN
jgi:hypothetical protein